MLDMHSCGKCVFTYSFVVPEVSAICVSVYVHRRENATSPTKMREAGLLRLYVSKRST